MTRIVEVRRETVKAGIGLGTALAVAISYVHNGSIIWAIVHGILSWLFVIYAAITYP